MLVSAIGHGAVIAMLAPATGYPVRVESMGALVVRWAEESAPTAAKAKAVAPLQPRPPTPRVHRILSSEQYQPTLAAELSLAPSATEPAIPAQTAEPAAAANANDESASFIAPFFNADYLSNPAPTYPPASRATGEQGKVLLSVQVSPTGEALEVRLRASSGFDRLDIAAMEAVRRWKFVPARQGAEAVTAWVVVPISFSLRR
jgi:periplasmic protein TonB